VNILLVHQLFASRDQPGGTRHFEFASRWAERGHNVVVITSDLTYLTGERSGADHGWISEEKLGNLTIVRAYTARNLHRSFAARVYSYLTFMVVAVMAGLRCGKPDVVIGTSPPIFQWFSSWLLARIHRAPLVLEVRDLWPEFAVDMGVIRNPAVIRVARLIERFFYRQAKLLIINSPGFRPYLEQCGVDGQHIRLVPNGVSPDDFDPEGDGQEMRRRWNADGQFVAVYAGALGQANDIPTILAAAEQLHGAADIRFVLVGDGKERPRLEQMAAAKELRNVKFAGTVSKRQMCDVLAAADVCVATLQDIAMFRTTYPNKVFDYMAAGRPIVLAIDGVIREVVEQAEAGLCVKPGDDAALAQAIHHLQMHPQTAAEMGRKGRAYVSRHFDRASHADQFERLLRSVVLCRRAVHW